MDKEKAPAQRQPEQAQMQKHRTSIIAPTRRRVAPDARADRGVKLAGGGFAVLLIGAALADMAPLGLAALVMALGVGILWKGAFLCERSQ